MSSRAATITGDVIDAGGAGEVVGGEPVDLSGLPGHRARRADQPRAGTLDGAVDDRHTRSGSGWSLPSTSMTPQWTCCHDRLLQPVLAVVVGVVTGSALLSSRSSRDRGDRDGEGGECRG